MKNNLRNEALDYHKNGTPGKLAIVSTKPTQTQKDLSLCYTPGVAIPVEEIAKNSAAAYEYTSKGNLVAVITNGTAVLGLGAVGALASKPVMEGKAILFKRFANVDVFDIEIDCNDPNEFIETVVRIAPTFGGINLEDIKAPECFMIEEELKKRLNIPVFHDDQHGTAIVVTAGLLNALELQHKKLQDCTIVCAGAGAAGIAIMNLLKKVGADPQKLLMIDRAGVIHEGRKDLNNFKQAFAINTSKRTLADACEDADIFIGVSGPEIFTQAMLKTMAPKPIVFALSNPIPEIMPELAYSVRDDVIVATGRSDYPNQINNALCFPYIFRGALDTRSTCINAEMQMAAVEAIRKLAKEQVPSEVLTAYGLTELSFGPFYLVPKMLDPRLNDKVSKAVAKAAIDSKAAN